LNHPAILVEYAGAGFLRATMSQKSSLPQAASFVSQVLKRDTAFIRQPQFEVEACRWRAHGMACQLSFESFSPGY
jgi:hypothetical protein